MNITMKLSDFRMTNTRFRDMTASSLGTDYSYVFSSFRDIVFIFSNFEIFSSRLALNLSHLHRLTPMSALAGKRVRELDLIQPFGLTTLVNMSAERRTIVVDLAPLHTILSYRDLALLIDIYAYLMSFTNSPCILLSFFALTLLSRPRYHELPTLLPSPS